VEQELAKSLNYPHPIGAADYSEGVAYVNFLCSENGAPSKVAIGKSSGHPALDKAAIRAISRIATLHPLPKGMLPDQKYQAAILFQANGGYGYDRKLAAMRRKAKADSEWFEKRGIEQSASAIRLVPAGGM
jgi:protein TonB